MCSTSNDDLAGRFCTVPWHHFEVALHQKVYLCCPGYLPVPIGDLRRESPFAIWNSTTARSVRQSIIDGSFRFCKKDSCPDIANRRLPLRDPAASWDSDTRPPSSLRVPSMLENAESLRKSADVICENWPTRIQIANDRSCNLACPSCRPRFVISGPASQGEIRTAFQKLLPDALMRAKRLRLNGAGEFLVSGPCRGLLRELSRKRVPSLRFEFITNGQLFSRSVYEDFDLAGRIALIYVSIDAASSSTYNRVRPGGEFHRLLQHLDFMRELRKDAPQETLSLVLSFVVSALNFHEMPQFIELARRFDGAVSFSRIRNWGHLSDSAFAELDVASETHPMHDEFVTALETLRGKEAPVDISDLAGCLSNRDRTASWAAG